MPRACYKTMDARSKRTLKRTFGLPPSTKLADDTAHEMRMFMHGTMCGSGFELGYWADFVAFDATFKLAWSRLLDRWRAEKKLWPVVGAGDRAGEVPWVRAGSWAAAARCPLCEWQRMGSVVAAEH